MKNKKSEMPKMKAISKQTLEAIRKQTAKYIYINKDGKSVCQRCNKESEITEKTKHKDKIKCPKCKKEMIIQHTWRKDPDDEYDWRVVATALNDGRLALRYVLVWTKGLQVMQLEEVARKIMDFRYLKEYNYEKSMWDNKGWRESTFNFFRERGMGYGWRRLCCLPADIYNTKQFITEVHKIDTFKYWDFEKHFSGKTLYVNSEIGWLGRRADLYEKLDKIGLSELVNADMKATYRKGIEYDKSARSLHKMLKMNKTELKMLIKYPTLDTYHTLLGNNNVRGQHQERMFQYIKDNNIAFSDYDNYLGILKKLEYPMTKYYLFPKDYYKMEKAIFDDYGTKEDAIKNSLIKKISDGLKKMPEIREFMKGTNGLLVYVPENAEEFRKEGRALDNCLRTYVDRVAEGKTFVFYIRKLNSPNTPFVACEYYNGKITQCRYKGNRIVDDENIINFAEAFANVLRRKEMAA